MNRSKAKGTAFETDVVRFIQSEGHTHVDRRALRGALDTGDISGFFGWVLEVKNHAKMDLGNWATEAEREAGNASRAGVFHRWAVIHKRRQHGVADSYVTLPLRFFIQAITERGED